MGNNEITIRDVGDCALMVEFAERLDPAVSNAALAFDQRVAREAIQGVIETSPTYKSVFIQYDPLIVSNGELRACCRQLLNERDWSRAKLENVQSWSIPAVYGGEAGPDLALLASKMDISEQRLIEQHSACRFTVLMLGFAPGTAYMGIMSEDWQIERRTDITPSVPAGSIAVALRQSILFSTETPTGWYVIARTLFSNFRPNLSNKEFLLSPGDEVTFDPVKMLEIALPQQQSGRFS